MQQLSLSSRLSNVLRYCVIIAVWIYKRTCMQEMSADLFEMHRGTDVPLVMGPELGRHTLNNASSTELCTKTSRYKQSSKGPTVSRLDGTVPTCAKLSSRRWQSIVAFTVSQSVCRDSFSFLSVGIVLTPCLFDRTTISMCYDDCEAACHKSDVSTQCESHVRLDCRKCSLTMFANPETWQYFEILITQSSFSTLYYAQSLEGVALFSKTRFFIRGRSRSRVWRRHTLRLISAGAIRD